MVEVDGMVPKGDKSFPPNFLHSSLSAVCPILRPKTKRKGVVSGLEGGIRYGRWRGDKGTARPFV
ncbi:hypothetical protein E2C01_076488 [Portunus trituberculatus]|uniref:Uncharacterized protein n=1 Tax=Portunus trituberculatus TaxID=210409 RepID=A0A5B7I8V0_PORTR|nr:hypothetical protein [Portunus trituberculatus]